MLFAIQNRSRIHVGARFSGQNITRTKGRSFSTASLPAFIRHNGNLAFFALLAVAASGFGQTFFISIFGIALRAEFSLSHAHYGMIYSGATLASALALMPMIAGLLLLSLRGDGWVPYAYLTLLGITQAGTGTAGGALWPERYGSRHLGAIRSVSQAAMVLATAVSPLVAGLLLDRGIGVEALAGLLAALVLLSALLTLLVRPLSVSAGGRGNSATAAG